MGDRSRRREGGQLLLREKAADERGNLYEATIWKVPASSRYREGIRYRLAFIRRGEAHRQYFEDNHHPKGHHRHVGQIEEPYEFEDVHRLVEDFQRDVRRVKGNKL